MAQLGNWFVLIYLRPRCPSPFSKGKHHLRVQGPAIGSMIPLKCEHCGSQKAYYQKAVK